MPATTTATLATATAAGTAAATTEKAAATRLRWCHAAYAQPTWQAAAASNALPACATVRVCVPVYAPVCVCLLSTMQRNCFHARHKVEQFLNKAIRRLIKDELQLGEAAVASATATASVAAGVVYAPQRRRRRR